MTGISTKQISTGLPGRQRTPRAIRPVAVLSWVMLALAICLLAYFLFKAGAFSGLVTRSEPSLPSDVAQEKVTVSTSSISGFDNEKQPYTINAQSAVQDPDKPNIIRLDTVTGEINRASGKRITMDARNGVYDSDSKNLELTGDVHIISDGRFVATMPSAQVTLQDKRLESGDPVMVTFDGGDIQANGVRITEEGKNIEFVNRVKVRLRAAADKEDRDGNE